jgi:hypothetical protein
MASKKLILACARESARGFRLRQGLYHPAVNFQGHSTPKKLNFDEKPELLVSAQDGSRQSAQRPSRNDNGIARF